MPSNIFEELSEILLNQKFDSLKTEKDTLNRYKELTIIYSQIENCIAVLSDMQTNKSYIRYGKVGVNFDLYDEPNSNVVDSIWEEEILNKIHSDDLIRKYIYELQFFKFLKTIPQTQKSEYYLSSILRMKDTNGNYLPIRHRIFYISDNHENNIRLSLCLYNLGIPNKDDTTTESVIINSLTGEVLHLDKKHEDLLSSREKEILSLIKVGKMSKEIAHTLSISINTVNRHRQNILEKLNVDNSIEACRVADKLKLL